MPGARYQTRSHLPLVRGGAALLACGLLGGLACGGSGNGGGNPPTPQPTPPAITLPGIWSGTANSGNSYMVILPAGTFWFLEDTTDSATTGNITVSGTTLGGSGNWYTGRLNHNVVSPVTLSGTAVAPPTPALNLDLDTGDNNLECALTPDTQANPPIQPADLAGNYAATDRATASGLAETFAVAADGLSFTGTNANGNYAGSLTPITGVSAYSATGTFTPSATGQPAVAFSGVAYQRAGTATALILIANTSVSGGNQVIGGIYSKN